MNVGDRVRTNATLTTTDQWVTAQAGRRPNALGFIQSSGGYYFTVEHNDGTTAPYTGAELHGVCSVQVARALQRSGGYHIREDVAEGPGMSAVDAARLDDIGPDMLTPVQGGHVFAGTWEAFAECEDADCAACGAAIKRDGSDIVIEDVEDRVCAGWRDGANPGALARVARAIVRDAPEDAPNGIAEAAYANALDTFPMLAGDALPTLDHWHRASEALRSWGRAYSDEARALRLALEHEDVANEVGKLRAEVERLRAEVAALKREAPHRPLDHEPGDPAPIPGTSLAWNGKGGDS